jgi:hypothetical protein
MNILVVGNSHVGSLKRAYDNARGEIDNVKFYFVASRGRGLSSVEVRDGVLSSKIPQTMRDIEYTFGSASVDINKLDLDAVLMYGMGLNIPFGFVRSVINEDYSKQFVEKSYNEFSEKFGYRLAIDIASNTTVPSYIASPLPSGKGIHKENYSSELYARRQEEITEFQKQFLNNLKLNYFLQPIETFNPNFKTFTDYSTGSKRLSVGDKLDDEVHPADDYTHMNDMFGKIFIQSFVKNLKSSSL